MDQTDAATGRGRRPLALTAAAALVGVQGAVVVVLAVLELVNLTPGRAIMGITTTVFFAGYGAGLLLCATGLVRARSWARGPSVMAQLILLGLAWNARDNTPLATGLVVAAAITLSALMAPASRASLDADV